MRTQLVLLASMLFVPASAAPPNDAEVTFYSNGNLWMTGTPYANHAAFIGFLYDGAQRVGFVQPRHFLTLHVTPGKHNFSASMSPKHPAENSQLQMDLIGGKRYFIRMQEESRGAMVIGTEKGRLDIVTCEIAHTETAKERPTDPKRIAPEMRDKIVSTPSLPACE